MCREGADPVAVKVAIRQAQERITTERDHLSQWSAFTANHRMEGVSARLRKCEELLAEAERLLEENVKELAQMTLGPDQGVTITRL
jgi:hypothetical protein